MIYVHEAEIFWLNFIYIFIYLFIIYSCPRHLTRHRYNFQDGVIKAVNFLIISEPLITSFSYINWWNREVASSLSKLSIFYCA